MNRNSALLCTALLCAACDPSTNGTGAVPNTPTSSTSSATNSPSTGDQPQSDPPVTATPSVDKPAPLTPDKPADGAASASNGFAFDMLHQLGKTQGNLAYSPASISVALAMTFGGAQGETASQMAKVLHFPEDPALLHGSWRTVLASWQAKDKPYELEVANRLFGEKSFKFEPSFLKLTETSYGAPLESRNFASNPDAERVYINNWVEQRTKQRIKDLIPPQGIDSDTRMVLTNAIYFKAQWAEPFNEMGTADADFYAASGKVTVKMMNHGLRARHVAADGVQLLELPYKDRDFSMVVVLPDDKAGLANVEQRLSAGQFEQWYTAMTYQRVNVGLPRFKIDPPNSLALKQMLSTLGMPLAFVRGQADFSGMANPSNPDDKLSIGNVFHKAFVAVDEKGTEAAAATAVVMARAGSAAPAKPIAFRADRPFLFFIRDNKNKLITFIGRVADPR